MFPSVVGFNFDHNLVVKRYNEKKIGGLGFNLKTTLDKAHDNCAKKSDSWIFVSSSCNFV